MTNTSAAIAATSTALLATLREATGTPDLGFATLPVALSGGFYADMSTVDVRVATGPVLATGIGFADITGYAPVPAGDGVSR